MCEIDRLAKLEDGRERSLPPKLRILIYGIAVLPRRGQGGFRHALDVATLIDGTGANPTCADVYAEEPSRHHSTPSFQMGFPLEG